MHMLGLGSPWFVDLCLAQLFSVMLSICCKEKPLQRSGCHICLWKMAHTFRTLTSQENLGHKHVHLLDFSASVRLKCYWSFFLFSGCTACPQACVTISFYAYGFLNSIELGFQYSVVSYSSILPRSSCTHPIHTLPIFLCIFYTLFSYSHECVKERIWCYLLLFQCLMTGDVIPGRVSQAEWLSWHPFSVINFFGNREPSFSCIQGLTEVEWIFEFLL